MPLISCVMPVYNAEKYLKEAIHSVLSQTFGDFEFLIMDDGSTDCSLGIIKEFAEKDKRIIYYHQENKGLPCALNELIKKARGKYIARMDSDDISFRKRFEVQYGFMERHPEIAVTGSNVVSIGRRSAVFFGTSKDDRVRNIRMLFSNAGVPHPTAFIRADFLKEHGILYNANNIAAEDYELWADIIRDGGVIHLLDRPLLYYRIHKGQITDVFSKNTSISVGAVKEKQLKKFGSFTQEEINEIKKMRYIGYTLDVELLFRTLNKLKRLNRRKGMFEEKMMGDEIAFQWLYAASLRAKHNKDYRMFCWKYLAGVIGLKHGSYALWNLYHYASAKFKQGIRAFYNLKFGNPI